MIAKNILTLARSNLQAATKKLCTEEFANNIEEIIDFLQTILPKKIATAEEINKEFASILKNKCEFLSINNERYPKLLKQTQLAPIFLTIRGNIDFLQSQNIAFSGSRQLDAEDFAIIREIVKTLNDLDIGIISGLAHGSDIVAHIQSIKTGTIAIMPCGLQNCYPKEHKDILEKIIDFGGTVISEFSFFEPPKQQNFIKRNATIVGMSNAVIIGRARDIKSGSMSSANFANKFNKQIYTLLFDGICKGNEFLLENNRATEITDLEELKYSILANIAENEMQSDKKINKTQSNKEKSFLFSNVGEKSIRNEVRNILLYSENCQEIKKNEANLMQLFNLCCEELQPDGNDRKEILKGLLEIVMK